MQWKRPYTAIGGFGLGILMWVLEMAEVAIPSWLLIIIGLIAFGMVLFGSMPVVVSVYHGIQRVKPRMPFVVVRSGAVKASQEEVTQEIIVKEYPPQVGDRLDTLIQRGDRFCHIMRERGFSRWQIEPDVGEWINDVNRDVWEIVPEHASDITADQGDVTEGEKIKYEGWSWPSALLRVSVDRLLMKLRETRSKIRVADKEGSQTE